MNFCDLCNKFIHTTDTCLSSKGTGTATPNVNSVQSADGQGVVATLSEANSEPIPRIMGTVTQEGESEGLISVLPDSGSVAEVMPISMAADLGLSLQAVDPDKYKLASANSSPIAVQHSL